MQIVFVPSRLRRLSALLWVAIPLGWLELAIYSRAHWSQLPVPSVRFWGAVSMLIVGPLIYWMNRGRFWAIPSFRVLGAIWVVLSVWLSWKMKNPNLGFFSIFLAGFVVVVSELTKSELSRTYISSGRQWWEGAPRALPGLHATVHWNDQQTDARVSRLDRDGVFVFGLSFIPTRGSKGSEKIGVELKGNRGDTVWRFQGQIVTIDAQAAGVGIRILPTTLDEGKDLGDLFETMKGRGYVD